MENKWHYFSSKEVEGLDQELVAKLDQARHLADIPFVITSGYRAGDARGIDHGLLNGPHMSRKAVDLRCRDSGARFRIIFGLISAGFKRIGIGKIHIHADICGVAENKPVEVAWLEFEDDKPEVALV